MFLPLSAVLHRIREIRQQLLGRAYVPGAVPVLLMLLILGLQNVAYFSRHLLSAGIFPHDFLLTYQALPYYLVEVARLGGDTSWIPFQGMGYPTYMNLQNGFDYLPIRMLSWFGVSYSFQVAVWMQVLHVFAGAVGAAVCARAFGLKWWQAILAGIFYQGFGGFYSNAQHPDIVRAFAFLPWLCAPVFMPWSDISKGQAGVILTLPFWMFMQWTGAYPGATLAALLVLGAVTTIRIWADANTRTTGLCILAALLAGSFLAGMTILPALLDAHEIRRSTEVGKMSYDYLVPSDLLSLIFPITNDRLLQHDLSMRSLFVGLPVVALFLLSFWRWCADLKWPLAALVLASLIACGLLHPLLIRLVPQLGASRFVLADYRGIIGLVMVLMACSALRLREDHPGRMAPLLPGALLMAGGCWFFAEVASADWVTWNMDYVICCVLAIGCIPLLMLIRPLPAWISRLALVAALIAAGGLFLLALTYLFGSTLIAPRRLLQLGVLVAVLAIFSARMRIYLPHLAALLLMCGGAFYLHYLYAIPAHGQVPTLLALLIPFALSAVALWCLPGPGRWLAPVLLVGAAVMNWAAVHWEQSYFLARPADGVSWVEARAGKFSDTRPRLIEALRGQRCRTARRDVSDADGVFPWNGYYTGEYFMRDYSGPLKLGRHLDILASDSSRAFAQQAWHMLALRGSVSSVGGTLELEGALPVDAACLGSSTASERIRVHLDAPALVVENEIYWKGWTAQLECVDCSADQGKLVRLDAINAGGFRAWQLPAGTYLMQSRFDQPHRMAAMGVTLLGLLLWTGLTAVFMRHGAQRTRGQRDLAVSPSDA